MRDRLLEEVKVRSEMHRSLVRSNLQTWITYKNKEPYFMYLEFLEKTTQSLFLQEKSFNPEEELRLSIIKQLPKDEVKLFDRLVHSITLLNHMYRVHHLEKGYESIREDVLNAASLLQLSFNPESMLFIKTKMIYWGLEEFYGVEEFTVREASLKLIINQKTMSKHIMALRNVGYVKHVRTGIRNTYYYQIV